MDGRIFFPTPWEQVDKDNDNIDVCLTLPDGTGYTFVVTTPANLQALMEKDGLPYLRPSSPSLIVERLTEENVLLLIEELQKDPVLLRLYGADLSEPTVDPAENR